MLERARSQNHFFMREDAVPYKLEPGNVTHELVAALPAIPEYLRELDRAHGGEGTLDGAFARIEEHEAALAAPLLEFLESHAAVTLLGPGMGPDRAPTISFLVDGRASSELPPLLDAERIAIRYGHFYAYRLVERLRLMERDGVVRVSMAHYNAPDEVARLIAALDAAI